LELIYRRSPGHERNALVPATVEDMIVNYRTCEFTTVFRDGSPQTWPVTPLLLHDGRFLICTSIGLPQKALNVRRNPKVSMLFSEPTGSGVSKPGAVLVQGDAAVADGVFADVLADRDLAALTQTVLDRQPRGAMMSNWFGRRFFPFYYVRLLIHVTPRRLFSWSTPDGSSAPCELDLSELNHVG
jgi:hypothetical protein